MRAIACSPCKAELSLSVENVNVSFLSCLTIDLTDAGYNTRLGMRNLPRFFYVVRANLSIKNSNF